MDKQENIFRRVAAAIKGEPKPSGDVCFSKLCFNDQRLVLGALTNSAFDIPEIKNAINFVAEVFSTIPIYHKRTDSAGNTEYPLSNINFVLNIYPNVLQNKTTFWITTITQLLKNNNVAIYPEMDGSTLMSVAPVPYSEWKIEERNGEYYVFFAADPKKYPVKAILLLSRFCTLEGGNKRNSLTLHQSIMQAIQKRAEENALNPRMINAIIKYKQGNIKEQDARRKQLEDQIMPDAGKDRKIPFVQGDLDLLPFDFTPPKIETELLADVTEIVYNYFGLTKELIQRKASEVQYEMFINTTIKPLANQVSEEFSKKLFSRRELQVGNWLELDLTALQIASLDSKTRFFQQAIPYGVINADEAREYIGFGKIPNGIGARYMQTLNMVDANMATEYQMNAAKNGIKPVQTETNVAAQTNSEDNNNA